jgi:beta-galactosidase/beta-glucuronidase
VEVREGADSGAGGAVLDADRVAVGLRTVQVDPHRGFRLNGETLKLRGACIHHDNGALGAVSLPAAEERRVRLLKEAGFNAIRTAHNPASQALLQACDRLGMLVMNELADSWSSEERVRRHAYLRGPMATRRGGVVAGSRNHPSVVMYSLGERDPEIGRPTGALWGRRLGST